MQDNIESQPTHLAVTCKSDVPASWTGHNARDNPICTHEISPGFSCTPMQEEVCAILRVLFIVHQQNCGSVSRYVLSIILGRALLKFRKTKKSHQSILRTWADYTGHLYH